MLAVAPATAALRALIGTARRTRAGAPNRVAGPEPTRGAADVRYRLKALKAGSGVVALELDARDLGDATAQARAQGYAVLGTAGGAAFALPRLRRAPRFPLLLFTQELLALLDSGIALVEAIETLVEKEARPETRAALQGVLARLYEGKPLSAALEAEPDAFPTLYIATARAAERTGDLPEALGRYIAYQRQLDAVRAKVVSAAIYPVILLVVAAAVMLFLLGYVVPRFSGVYEDMGDRIPWASRVLLQWGKLVEAQPWLVIGGAVAAVVGTGVAVTRPATRAAFLRALRRLPAFDTQLRTWQLTRFYRTLGMLLAGGIPIVTALQMVGGLLDAQLRARLDGATRAIREGRPLSVAMEAHDLVTPVALRMLRVGERTGRMGDMMERIAVFHEDAFARWLDTFVKAIGPALMVLIGIVIGTVVVLMYLPIFELAGSIG
jgi:general secretion pathway protein F